MSDRLLYEDDFLSQETANLLASTLEQPPHSTINRLHTSKTTTTTTTPTTNSPSYAATSSGFSTFNLNLNNQTSPDSSSSLSSSTKRKADSPPEDSAATVVLKRQRNTMAARKYRQKRLDRIAELEQALADMTGDRDDLRLKLVRREAEVDALREMLGKK
ncbi:bZIP transcription factor, bZIP-1 [Ilyonectria destructans]|nr:bZIP transcription factor, bZIP-1 [Ilyonectria destructans]